MGIFLGAAYLAGAAARSASNHAHASKLALVAANGFSEAALKAETVAMEPGALAIARRHDPLAVMEAADRDRQEFRLASSLEPATHEQGPAAPSASSPVLRASFNRPVSPARPFVMSNNSPLAGARELDCLSTAVYYEARGESTEGQAAVAQVVLNRVRHPAFPKSVCAVVYQGSQAHDCQFSFACNGAMRAPKEEAAWRRAQAVAARALSGFVMRAVGDATNFHAARVSQDWAAGFLKVAQVGAHVFYRFSGRPSTTPVMRAAPDLYTPPPAPKAADGGGQPALILASAVTTSGPASKSALAAEPAVKTADADKPAPGPEKAKSEAVATAPG
jgi:spore germination cell wall hydrolase CwlJ-like protein